MLLFFLTSSCTNSELNGSLSNSNCVDTNCIDYSSQFEAQRDFDWDPICRADLDADNDGIACEENQWTDYYNSINNSTGGSNGSGCPTTANCGCSNKSKSQCENDQCCQWIVGTGCKCD